jgi:hypothetical protein
VHASMRVHTHTNTHTHTHCKTKYNKKQLMHHMDGF